MYDSDRYTEKLNIIALKNYQNLNGKYQEKEICITWGSNALLEDLPK